MGYEIIKDEDPVLKKARAAAKTLWVDNYATADLPSTSKSSYESRVRTLFSDKGYEELHTIIFDTIAEDKDPDVHAFKTKFFGGLCEKLKKEGLTYDSLKHCLRPRSKDIIEDKIAARNQTKISNTSKATV